MVLPSKTLMLGRLSSELGLLSLNRVFHGIRLNCGQLHRVADIPLFVVSLMATARLSPD
jgi:hypothetical protein